MKLPTARAIYRDDTSADLALPCKVLTWNQEPRPFLNSERGLL